MLFLFNPKDTGFLKPFQGFDGPDLAMRNANELPLP
jgi:hypothetical protein